MLQGVNLVTFALALNVLLPRFRRDGTNAVILVLSLLLFLSCTAHYALEFNHFHFTLVCHGFLCAQTVDLRATLLLEIDWSGRLRRRNERLFCSRPVHLHNRLLWRPHLGVQVLVDLEQELLGDGAATAHLDCWPEYVLHSLWLNSTKPDMSPHRFQYVLRKSVTSSMERTAHRYRHLSFHLDLQASRCHSVPT